MKGSPFKQATLESKNKINEGNTKKVKNKPKEKTITDFTSDTQEASGSRTHDSNQYRTWKDLHWVEKGAAINAGLIPLRIARDLMKKKK